MLFETAIQNALMSVVTVEPEETRDCGLNVLCFSEPPVGVSSAASTSHAYSLLPYAALSPAGWLTEQRAGIFFFLSLSLVRFSEFLLRCIGAPFFLSSMSFRHRYSGRRLASVGQPLTIIPTALI